MTREAERGVWILGVALAFGLGVLWSGDPKVESEAPTQPAQPAQPPLAGAAPFTRVRVVAANLTSGPNQSYDPGHGQRILKALDADVALLQELNAGNGSPEALRRFVDEAFGAEFYVHRERGAQIPNGVVSRWPIRESGVWEDSVCPNRELVWARIDVPGAIDLWAVSVHFLTRNPSTRAKEGRQLAALLREHVPPADYLVVGGDLNTKTIDEPVLRVLEELVSTRRVPADAQGRTGTNASRRRPYDWVLPDSDLEAFHVPVELGGQRYPDGLVFDSRVFGALDAVPPVRKSDSAADQMQHMAVVKDFLIPSSE